MLLHKTSDLLIYPATGVGSRGALPCSGLGPWPSGACSRTWGAWPAQLWL